MAQQSKTQFLQDVYDHLKRRYKSKGDRTPADLSVLEAVVYGICHEDTTREHANQALSRFKDGFFDWNEVRVSSLEEIQEGLAGIPDPEARAHRIRRFLRQMFSRTYGFSLDGLKKKPLKEALKTLQAYEAFQSDYVTATVIQQALKGHAIPVDKACHRVIQRLGIPETDVAELRATLERAVSKNRGVEFLDLIEDLASDTCVEGEPDCPRCELRKICPTAASRKLEASQAATRAASATRAAARKPAPAPPEEPPPAPTKAAKRAEPAATPAEPAAKPKKGTAAPTAKEPLGAPTPAPKSGRGKSDRSKN